MESIRFGAMVVAGALIFGSVPEDVSAIPVAGSHAKPSQVHVNGVDHPNQTDDQSPGVLNSRAPEPSLETLFGLIESRADFSHELGASENSNQLGHSDVSPVREPGSLALIGLGLLALLVLGRMGRKR